jgi:hypothetical protein
LCKTRELSWIELSPQMVALSLDIRSMPYG